MATAPTYVFRDDLQKEQERQDAAAQAGVQAAPSNTPAVQSAIAPAAQPPAGGDPFGSLAKTMAATAAPRPAQPAQQAQVNPFEAFNAALEAQRPIQKQIQQSVEKTLANPYEAADASNAAARDRLAREANAAAEERRGQAVTAYGGYGTGQATRDLNKFQDTRLLNQQSFELDAAGNRAQLGEQTRSNAVSQGLGLLGENRAGATTAAGLADSAASRTSQENIAYAGLAQTERQMAIQASQFKSQQDFTAAMTEKGYAQDEIARAWQAAESEKARASQEKISYAQLSLEEKKLVTQADQFDNELDFKKAALANGNDQAAIDRAWNASQNTDERALREKLANAQIGSAERLQAGEQAWQSAEAAKAQTLEKMLSDDRIQAQFGLATLDQTFQEKMQTTGYLQTKDLQAMRNDFEKELQASGIAADVAKQLADHQYSSMEAQRDRVFNASQSELNRTWESGERIGAQDWQTSFKQLEFNQQDLMQEREAALQKGLQTEQIDAEIKKVGMQIASQELMSAAQLAQEDRQWAKDYLMKKGIAEEEIAQSRAKLADDLATSLINREGLGLQNDVAKLAIQNSKVQSAMDLANWGVEMGNGSPEAMAPFVASIGQALSTALKEQGVNLTEEQIAKMIGSVGTTETPGGTGGAAAPGTLAATDSASEYFDSISDKVSANADPAIVDSMILKAAKPAFALYPQDPMDPNSKTAEKLDRGIVNEIAAKYPSATTSGNNPTYRKVSNDPYPTTQAAQDFYYFFALQKQGLTEKQAYDTLSRAIGKERLNAAYKTVTQKDWAA